MQREEDACLCVSFVLSYRTPRCSSASLLHSGFLELNSPPKSKGKQPEFLVMAPEP